MRIRSILFAALFALGTSALTPSAQACPCSKGKDKCTQGEGKSCECKDCAGKSGEKCESGSCSETKEVKKDEKKKS
jgi:hypothetical protein